MSSLALSIFSRQLATKEGHWSDFTVVSSQPHLSRGCPNVRSFFFARQLGGRPDLV
jgi:hypothetical protein